MVLGSAGLPDVGRSAYQAGMAPSGETIRPPVLLDRALLAARQARARKIGTATFLLDRVAEDIDERLRAVLREFSYVADIWTPGKLLPERFGKVVHLGI